MFRSTSTPSGKFVYLLLQSTLNLVLMLALSLGSAGGTAAVQAAPPGQEPTLVSIRPYLNVVFPGKLCVGDQYSIRVTPLAELNGILPDGKKLNFKDRIITGVSIKAETTDPSIATIEPPNRKISGYLPGKLWETTSLRDQDSGSAGRLGEVVFTLKAIKTGTTNFFLTAEVPKQWSSSTTAKYFGPEGMPVGGPITVVNCKYKVQIYFSMLGLFAQNTSGYIMGYMETLITTEDGKYYRGSGVLDVLETRSLPGCASAHTGFKSPTTITGESTGEGLELTIKYEPGQYTFTSCGGGGSGSEDPAPWLQSGGIFAETGGSQSKRLEVAGWIGTATTTVTPVTNSAP